MRNLARSRALKLVLAMLPALGGCTVDESAPAESSPPSVRSQLVDCTEEASEPNDTRATAASHAFGQSQPGALCGKNLRDYYSFQGPASGQAFSLRLEFSSIQAELELYLTDAAGNWVTSTYGSGDNRVVSAVSNGGKYYVQVEGRASASYRLVSALGSLPRCAEADPDEPNDFYGDFKALSFGSPYAAFNCAGENDYYQFQGPPSGQEFTVSLVFDHEAGDLDFNLSSTTTTYRARSRNDNETMSLVSNGGIYTLQVAGPNFNNSYGSASNTYEIRTELGYHPVSSCADEDELEPNDRSSLATPVSGTTDVRAFLCGERPDYYEFQGPSAGTPFFASVELDGPADVTVELINQAGVTVATGRTLVEPLSGMLAAELVGSISDGGATSSRSTRAMTPWLRPTPFASAAPRCHPSA